MPDNNGRLLGNRYLIVRRLSSGATGHVYLAEDTTKEPGHNLCAVKELSPNTADPHAYREFCERFRDEETYLRALEGFNGQIPKLYECFAERDAGGRETRYIVQEYIEGRTLRDRLREGGALHEAKVKEILASLLPVLDHIHSKDFIHRDINPTNIILRGRDELPVLIDFGAVKEVATTMVALSGDAGPQTVVIGKRGYMAPEHMRGRPVFASDLYSLGVTAIELLSGAGPGELERHPVTGGLLWRGRVQNVSPDLAAVLDKAVSEYAEQRYRDARSMLSALESAAVHESDDKIRRLLGDALPSLLKRPPRPPAERYKKCPACTFQLSPQDEYCPNCGAYNADCLGEDDLHLLRNSAESHLARIYGRGGESWAVGAALVLGFKHVGEGFAIVGGIAAGAGFGFGLAAWALTRSLVTSLGAGFLLAVAVLLAGTVVLLYYIKRVRGLQAKRRVIHQRVISSTSRNRRSGQYLNRVEQETTQRINGVAEQEKRIKGRLASTQSAAEDDAGDPELQEEERGLKSALAEAQHRHRKYEAKLLEIRLLRLHNQLQSKSSREAMGEPQRAQAESELGGLSRLFNEMFAALKEANALDSDSGKGWVARVLAAREIVAKSRRLLIKQMNELCVTNRESAIVAPPEELASNLDLLNAYVTLEDFYKEYEALRPEPAPAVSPTAAPRRRAST